MSPGPLFVDRNAVHVAYALCMSIIIIIIIIIIIVVLFIQQEPYTKYHTIFTDKIEYGTVRNIQVHK